MRRTKRICRSASISPGDSHHIRCQITHVVRCAIESTLSRREAQARAA